MTVPSLQPDGIHEAAARAELPLAPVCASPKAINPWRTWAGANHPGLSLLPPSCPPSSTGLCGDALWILLTFRPRCPQRRLGRILPQRCPHQVLARRVTCGTASPLSSSRDIKPLNALSESLSSERLGVLLALFRALMSSRARRGERAAPGGGGTGHGSVPPASVPDGAEGRRVRGWGVGGARSPAPDSGLPRSRSHPSPGAPVGRRPGVPGPGPRNPPEHQHPGPLGPARARPRSGRARRGEMRGRRARRITAAARGRSGAAAAAAV